MRLPTHRFFLTGVTVALLGALGTGGCAGVRIRKSKKNKAAAVESQRPAAAPFSGTVTLVNAEGRFVLIEGRFILPPADGTRLRVLRGDSTVATLSVSPEKRRPFVIADILGGTPRKGDRVVDDPTAPVQQPAPAPAVAEAVPPPPPPVVDNTPLPPPPPPPSSTAISLSRVNSVPRVQPRMPAPEPVETPSFPGAAPLPPPPPVPASALRGR